MKKELSIIICFALLTAFLCSCSNKETLAASGTLNSIPPYGNRLVTVFGDSIAAGYGLDNQSDNYLTIFAASIGATLNNNAISGYDSFDLLALLQSGSKSRDIQTANIIVLSIGGNDIIHQKDRMISTIKNDYLHGGEPFPEEIVKIYNDFENNLRECISLIRTVNPSVSIIIQTVYNPVLKQGYKVSGINVSKLINKYIDRLNESIHNVCDGMMNVCVFNVADEMNDDVKNFYDATDDFDIHPTAYGHKTLANIYTNNFNELVK